MTVTKALLVGVLAVAGPLALSVPAAAGPRGPAVVTPAVTTGQNAYVITDAPAAIRVGSSYPEIPLVVGTRFAAASVSIGLVDPQNGEIAFDDVNNGGTRTALRPNYYSYNVKHYGTFRWDIRTYDANYTEHDLSVDTVVKANSLLGLAVKRSGSRVTFTLATRAWNNAVVRYQGWGGRGVYIQKLTAPGTWQNVGGVTTNSAGNATKVLNTGAGMYRAYDKDAAVVFGSTTGAVRG